MTATERKIAATFQNLKGCDRNYVTDSITIQRIVRLVKSPFAESQLHDDERVRGLILKSESDGKPIPWTNVSLNGVGKELVKLKEKADELREALYNVRMNTWIYLLNEGFKEGLFERFMDDFYNQIYFAAGKLDATIAASPNNSRKTAGAPQKRAHYKIAQILADEFFKATRKKPTWTNPTSGGPATGPFVDLVTEVFTILDRRRRKSAGINRQILPTRRTDRNGDNRPRHAGNSYSRKQSALTCAGSFRSRRLGKIR